VLSRTIEALDRLNRVLSDQNIRTFTATLNDVQAVSAELRERKEVIADADRALQSAQQAAEAVTKLANSTDQLVNTDGKRTMKEAADAAEQVKAAATDARTMIGKLEGPTSDFATNGLPQLTATIVQLQQSAAALERLTNDIQQNPRGLVGKAPAKEVEVKP
jgi:phospholipid/cholesterol/gamma-HCH transport system substrate-binding protein